MTEPAIRIFKIIEYLANSDDWVSLRPMARELNQDAATVYRILSSMKELGYVRQHPVDSRYQLTLKIASVSARVLDKVQLRQVAHPIMEELTSITNETSHLAILDQHEFVYVHKVDNHQAIRMRSRVGQRGQLHCTAMGKAMLAFLPEAELNQILSSVDFQPMTPNTITSRVRFLEQVDLIRQQGYALDDEENEVGIRCIGAPVFDYACHVAGALSISGWTITVTPERVPLLADLVLQASRKISKDFGYIPIN
jgi:IclR family acetate operon transcriptional repressor